MILQDGDRYLQRHLRKNDYWAEGEKAVVGEWIGEAAAALGLDGAIEPRAFERLRNNRHPRTKEKLTVGDSKDRVALFDIQLSAPKDASVLAMVGDDPRVREAFLDAAKTALKEMERYAAVRERRGQAHKTEAFRITGNYVAGSFSTMPVAILIRSFTCMRSWQM